MPCRSRNRAEPGAADRSRLPHVPDPSAEPARRYLRPYVERTHMGRHREAIPDSSRRSAKGRSHIHHEAQAACGEFDWTLLRRAASLNGPTDIAITFADYVSVKNREARRFDQLTAETLRFIEEVERVAAAPVTMIATRFHSRSIIDRRSW